LRKKYPQSEEFMDNKLDVITSNYPFSVKGFTKDIKESLKMYDLTKHVKDTSQQIENFFLEDTIQKLKEGGVAGFIIFESVLWKKMALNNKLRHKLLVECDLVSVVKLGTEAFKNTSTKSVIIFLKKRKQEEINDIEKNVNSFFSNYQKVMYNNIDVIQEYVENTHGLSFEEYVELLINKTKIKGSKGRDFVNKEKENLIVYFSNYNKEIIYADLSFEWFKDEKLKNKQLLKVIKKKQREVLGMSKSSYDENKYQNSEYLPKLSELIKSFFNRTEKNIKLNDTDIETIVNINDVVNFENDGGYMISFDGNSNQYLSEDFKNVDFINLGDIVEFHPKTKHRADDGIIGGEYPFYTCSSDDEVYKTTNSADREGQRLLINNGGKSFIRMTENNSRWSASGDIIIMSSKDPLYTNEFIFKFLKNNPQVLEWTYKGSGLPHSSIGRLKKIMIPKMEEHEINLYLE